MAIGSRSQSARTYLEKHLDVFPNCATEELVAHGLRALRDTLPNEVELTTKVMHHTVHDYFVFPLLVFIYFVFHCRTYLSVLLDWTLRTKNSEKTKPLATYP